jgi:hypothetical protein
MFTFPDLESFVAIGNVLGNFKSENLIKSSKSPFVLSKFCHIWKIIFHVWTPAEIREIAKNTVAEVTPVVPFKNKIQHYQLKQSFLITPYYFKLSNVTIGDNFKRQCS